MTPHSERAARVLAAVNPDRLLDTAVRLVEIPSPTRSAGRVADRLADILRGDGWEVERPAAGWPTAPAVVTGLPMKAPGRVLQFNGHLDTVHLPFVPPRVENGVLTGSGASDMKGGIAAMLEALRAVRDAGGLERGGLLFTAHDLHESPWGDGSQVDELIREGYVGDGVLLPEYLADRIPVVGRGLAVLEAAVRRPGMPVHETLGGIDGPNVIQAGAEVIRRLSEIDRRLSEQRHPLAGRESVFIGQVASGEIFNQSPVEFRMSGTRRWLAGRPVEDVRREVGEWFDGMAADLGMEVECRLQIVRDAYELGPNALVPAVQRALREVTGRELPVGAKPFVDDGNTFVARGRVPAVTHGPDAHGAHTVNERVAVDELVRVARVYALAALHFCLYDPA
jgi:acetylornithine deacetylase/succinyl-diaminopimelate desuccinylase-like protein